MLDGRPHVVRGLRGVLRRLTKVGQQEAGPQERSRHRGPGPMTFRLSLTPVPTGQPGILQHPHRPPVIRQRS